MSDPWFSADEPEPDDDQQPDGHRVQRVALAVAVLLTLLVVGVLALAQ